MREFGVTGTREPLTVWAEKQVLPVMRNLMDDGYTIQHNGDCINADHVMARAWRRIGGTVWGHPPSNYVNRAWFAFDNYDDMVEKGYMERNIDIVKASEMLVAMPKLCQEELRSGTWHAVRQARKRCIRILFIWPDGRVEWDKPFNSWSS